MKRNIVILILTGLVLWSTPLERWYACRMNGGSIDYCFSQYLLGQ